MTNLRIPFRHLKEKFVLIELFQKRRRGVFLELNDERYLTCEGTFENFVSARDLPRWIKWKARKRRVLVAVDPSFAVILTLPLHLERDHDLIEEPLSSVELENLLAQAMVKIFNQHRSAAGRMLGVDELHAILVGNKVRHFKVDGHHVMNPLGFRGMRIEAVTELTITTRGVFEEWKEVFSSPEEPFFTEISRAELLALTRLEPLPLRLLALDEDGSYFFSLEKMAIGTMVSRAVLEWRTESIVNAFSEAYGVSPALARTFYLHLRSENASPAVLKAFKKLIRPVLEDLLMKLQKANVRGKVYVDANLPLPLPLASKGRKIVLHPFPILDLQEKVGFQIKREEWKMDDAELFRTLAPFIEFYYDKSDSSINHWLRRRLHWLIPSAQKQFLQ